MMMEMAPRYARGLAKPVIDRALPISALKGAFPHMGSRGVMGKLVMVK